MKNQKVKVTKQETDKLKYPMLQPLFEKITKSRAKTDAKMIEQMLQNFGDVVRLNPKKDVNDLLDYFLTSLYQKGSFLNPWTDKDNPPRNNIQDRIKFAKDIKAKKITRGSKE